MEYGLDMGHTLNYCSLVEHRTYNFCVTLIKHYLIKWEFLYL